MRRGGLTLPLRTVSSVFSHLDKITVKFEALIGVEPNALWAILKTLDYLWGRHYGPLCNFLVSGSIMTKFGVVTEFDKFIPKSPQNYSK